MVNCHCGKRGIYNFNTETPKRFCSTHRQFGMVNVVSKTCEKAGCNTRPTYNISGGKARFCAEHKEPNMVDVKHKT